jgi:hypothetical protein
MQMAVLAGSRSCQEFWRLTNNDLKDVGRFIAKLEEQRLR